MSVQLQIEEMPGYLKATFNGATTTEEVGWQFESLAEKCKCTNKNKLLLVYKRRGRARVAVKGIAPADASIGAGPE